MEHQQILDKWLWKRYRESVALWYQCAWWDKKYCSERWNMVWLSFWGSAINAWNWKWNLDKFFDRVEVPQQGDLFFCWTTQTNPHWHTGIHHSQTQVCEQNAWNRNGDGLGANAIRLGKYPKNVLGYMRPKWLKDPAESAVNAFADKYGIKWRSRTEPFSQFDTIQLLIKVLWQK